MILRVTEEMTFFMEEMELIVFMEGLEQILFMVIAGMTSFLEEMR